MRRISIDPITRLEGHGRIDIFLDDFGDVDECYLVIPEIRGFEKFVEGRPIEELPRITSRICGVCPCPCLSSEFCIRIIGAISGVTLRATSEPWPLYSVTAGPRAIMASYFLPPSF